MNDIFMELSEISRLRPRRRLLKVLTDSFDRHIIIINLKRSLLLLEKYFRDISNLLCYVMNGMEWDETED